MTQDFPIQRIPPTTDYIRTGRRHTEAEAEALAPAAAGADPFVHLHVHSNFSFLDGGSRIEELVARAASLGQSALALTDHDGLYGAVRFAKACAKHGLKPIFGAEVRVESLLGTDAAAGDGARPAALGHAAPSDPAPPHDDPHHLVLLAEEREGYANLCRLISAAHLADPERERRPLVTLASLRAHVAGLICLTGCRHGEVGYLIDAERDHEAQAALLELREIFGADHLYVELQYFGYHPHQEAYAGQHGTTVYTKAPHIGGRLRHQPAEVPPSSTRSRQGEPAAPPSPPIPPLPSKHPADRVCVQYPTLHPVPTATLVASWRSGVVGERTPAPAGRPAGRAPEQERPDLPAGTPRRLDAADYDVGFHHDGRPWHLSCLAYCERLARLAEACALPTVLTTNAHYAGPEGRALHLVCRAAGRDQPLSGYPEPVAGQRCLKSGAELEESARPLLELIEGVDPWDWLPDWCGDWAPSDYGIMHEYQSAISVAGGHKRGDGASRAGERPSAPSAGSLVESLPAPLAAPPRSVAAPLSATAEIAARCNVDLELGVYHFPQVEVPTGETAYSLLAQRCFRGVARRYRPVSMEAMALLEKELRMIQQMGFAHYFLVVDDIVRWSRSQGIACSGRGSAGNSIVCHALDITASDPIRHHLLFERFLNPNRREMPDIDVDFCSSRRDEVIEHIYKTFGEDNVAIVANVNTMSPRSAVRIVAEALGFAPAEIKALAAHVPRHGDAARLREYLAGGWPELRDSPLQDCARPGEEAALGGDAEPAALRGASDAGGKYWRLVDLAERLDGFPMHLGTHLGGFVIADKPITHYAPLQWAAKRLPRKDASPPGGDRRAGAKDAGSARSSATGATEDDGSRSLVPTRQPGCAGEATARGVVVLQFNKDDVAALGLVKMDILGLRTHSAVSECVHLVRQRTGRRIRPYDLPPDDPAAYEIISNGGSIGLFQLESAGQRNLASRLKERDFDDVIAAIALYRPGPLEAEMITPFIDRRWGLEPVDLPHPSMAEAVADTYGVILYQEQVLRIAQSVAGFDLADADSLRRAMTRDRSREEMAKIGETFISRAITRGVPEGAAREVFRQLEGFAAYGFNKSHSVCFAVISYATAWLKAYYPAEFLCSVLNNQPMGFYTPRTVLNDARRFGLTVRPLDVNLSGRGFTVEDKTPPPVWDTDEAPDLDLATHTGVPRPPGPAIPYDPFTQAWTAEHAWGLTEADLDEWAAEQEGSNSGDVWTGSAGPPAVSLTPGGEPPLGGKPGGEPPLGGREAPHPGDLPVPRAPRARGGVEPGACLAPSCGIAPDAGRALRVGFSYLKQMSERALARIEEERRHGPFSSFEDFYLRTRVEQPVAENLIRVGAFDSLEPDRTELLWRLPLLHDRLDALSGSSGQRRGQLRAFFCPPCRAGLERQWSLEDKVRIELDLLGLSVSCHPLQLYEEELRHMGVVMSYELPELGDEVRVTVAGVYERAQNPWMRSGHRTMFLTLEDAYGLFECVCFESKLAQIAPVVARASYFLVRGRLQNNHKRGLAIVAEEVRDLEEVVGRSRPGSREGRAAGEAARAVPKKVG